MKKSLTLLFLSFSIFAFSQNNKDSTLTTPIKVSGNVQLTNNGISPVPAFSLDKPALMTAFSIKKGNFSFSPQFNYGIDGKPWSSNNWLRLQFPHNKFTFRTGVNWSLFFKRGTYTQNNQAYDVKVVDRYLELEAAVFYQISEKITLQTIWWHAEGMDKTAVPSGNFYSLSASIAQLKLSNSFNLSLIPNLFYLKNKVPFEGLFISGIAVFSYKKSPFTLSTQGVQPIWVEPKGKFNWNIGLNYSF